MAATSAALVTSARNARASPPSPVMMAAVSCAAARFTSAQNTLAPSRAKVTAVALPLPHPGPIEPAPTTIAVLPERRPTRHLLFFRSIGWPKARGQLLNREVTDAYSCRNHRCFRQLEIGQRSEVSLRQAGKGVERKLD